MQPVRGEERFTRGHTPTRGARDALNHTEPSGRTASGENGRFQFGSTSSSASNDKTTNGTLYISGDAFFNGISWSNIKNDFKDWVYQGKIRNGKPHGQGTLTFDDGSRHVGEWKNGKRDGKGTFYSSSGIQSPGVWLNGRLQFEKN